MLPHSHLLRASALTFQLPGAFSVGPVTFKMEGQTKLVIAGETGSGKSTLLKMIGGLVQPSSGAAYFDDRRVEGPLEKLIPGHPGIAYLSQHYELRNNYTVFDLLDYGSELSANEAQQLFQLCEIDHLLLRKTNSGLSGGEKQRIALAKLLATKPKLLLLDEPFSNLDVLHKQVIKQVIRKISDELGTSIILVSHDPMDTLSWASRIMVMQHGQIVQDSSPNEIYHQPVSKYVAGLFGAYNLLPIQWLSQHQILPKASLNTTEYLLRPEHIQLNNPYATNMATVKDCQFCGTHYLVLMDANGIMLNAIHHHPMATGDTIQFSVDVKFVWPLAN